MMLIILQTLDNNFLIIFKTNQNDTSAEKPSHANPDHFIDMLFQPEI